MEEQELQGYLAHAWHYPGRIYPKSVPCAPENQELRTKRVNALVENVESGRDPLTGRILTKNEIESLGISVDPKDGRTLYIPARCHQPIRKKIGRAAHKLVG